MPIGLYPYTYRYLNGLSCILVREGSSIRSADDDDREKSRIRYAIASLICNHLSNSVCPLSDDWL